MTEAVFTLVGAFVALLSAGVSQWAERRAERQRWRRDRRTDAYQSLHSEYGALRHTLRVLAALDGVPEPTREQVGHLQRISGGWSRELGRVLLYGDTATVDAAHILDHAVSAVVAAAVSAQLSPNVRTDWRQVELTLEQAAAPFLAEVRAELAAEGATGSDRQLHSWRRRQRRS